MWISLSNLAAIYPLYRAQTPLQYGLVTGFMAGCLVTNTKLVDKKYTSLIEGLSYSPLLLYFAFTVDRSTPLNFWLAYFFANLFCALADFDLMERSKTLAGLSIKLDEDLPWFTVNRALFQICAYSWLAALF
nr:putative membrane protein [Cedratvirus lena]